MVDSEINSQAFQLARLRSERTRVYALLGVLGSLLLLVLVRGGISLAQGRRGEAWPFVLLLALMTAYEALWLRFVGRAIDSGQEDLNRNMGSEHRNRVTATHRRTVSAGSRVLCRTLSSAHLAGRTCIFPIHHSLHSAPQPSALAFGRRLFGYWLRCSFSLRISAIPRDCRGREVGGLRYTRLVRSLPTCGRIRCCAVGGQIRLHVVGALREAESRAKIAQLEHDLGIARSIQQGLLPKAAPKVPGFDIAGWNQPADETGGDYFDWQQLADGRVAVTIADVTGHGIGSALCMAACRAYARSGLAIEPDLGSFLSRMNQLLHRDLPSEKFVTLAAGVLNPSDATLHLISAGHGPLLFYSSSENRFHAYDAQGLPLGLLPGASYAGAQELKFGHGDVLLLVTDGFLEWTNTNDEDFGEERAKEVIRANHEMSSARIISELYSAVVKFAGPMPQLDDLTALIVRRV